jgi:TRAP-type C4-dicarboxylate transport system permease small subunit
VTGWPWWLVEVALYAVIAGIVIAMMLDARRRWKQLHERLDAVELDGDGPILIQQPRRGLAERRDP